MRNVVIAGYVRSPFHLAGKGALARVRPDDLAAQTIRGLVEKTGVNAAGDRGYRDGLRLPGRRAGLQHRAAGRPAGGPADLGRRDDGEPVLRLLDERDPHRRGPDRHRRGRGVHLRGHRIDEPCADDRLQPDAQPGTGEEERRLHVDGRDCRERGAELWAEPRGAGRLRRRAARPRRVPRSRRAISPTRSCRSPRRTARSTKTAPPRPGTTTEALGGLKPAFDRTAPSRRARPRR